MNRTKIIKSLPVVLVTMFTTSVSLFLMNTACPACPDEVRVVSEILAIIGVFGCVLLSVFGLIFDKNDK